MEYEIINAVLYGIKKPHVLLELKTSFSIKEIEIYINNHLYKKIINDIADKVRYFKLEEELDSNIKNIVIFVCDKNDKKMKVYAKRYGKIIRTKKVLTKPFRVIANRLRLLFSPIIKAVKIMWQRHHFIIPPSKMKKYLKSFIRNYTHALDVNFLNPENVHDYSKWLSQNKSKLHNVPLEYNPLISVIIPVYNANQKELEECIYSVLKQTYQNFEICISDDNSSNKDTITTLKTFESNDKIKIVYRNKNGMISENMNSAIKISSGEFITFLDNDDVLDENALYYIVKELNENKKIDMIYTDEDKISENGTFCDPNFKPDWSPDTFLSMNYICHFTAIRRSVLDKAGLFDSRYDGAQDYDLFLRVTEKTDRIVHIPKILYHWRKSATSTAASNNNKDYARMAGKRAIEAALRRRKINAEVILDTKTPFYIVDYKLNSEPSVSIIIPTKNSKDILEKCINSILNKTTYKNYEIVIVDNNSDEEKTLNYLNEVSKKYNHIRIIRDEGEFNYSKINNDAIKSTNSDYIMLLNNDTEVITDNWLTTMVGYASQKHIGCVGAKLLYPDYTVQHAGVILGLGGVASHAYIGADRKEVGYFGRLCVPYNYSANTAACLLVSRKKFDEVGGLEEELKVAYNDIDFNMKLLKKGYYNVFLPQIELIHYESKTRGHEDSPEKKERFKQESEYMLKKWEKEINNDIYYNYNFSKKGWFVLERRNK